MTHAHPTTYPCPGRFVVFHHGTDLFDWPALVLQTTLHNHTHVVMGRVFQGGGFSAASPWQVGEADETRDWTPTEDELPLGWYWRCQLQVFRPRANEWVWAVEGVESGQWSWPTPVFVESQFNRIAVA